MRRHACLILRPRALALPPVAVHDMLGGMSRLADVAGLIAEHAPTDGFHSTAFDRLMLARASTVTLPMPNVYRPQLCLVAQGRKEVSVGPRTFSYAPGRYGVVIHDLPVTGRVIEATPAKPYLCLFLDFDPVMLGSLASQIPVVPVQAAPAMRVSEAGASLVEAILRLLRLLDEPSAVPVLGPSAEQEVLYRLLTGPDGPRMWHVTSSQGRLAQVGRAVGWIGRHYRQGWKIERLAAEIGMSPSSLHAHFRAVTAMTPLQFQKQLRLQEARSLMLVNDLDAAAAAFRVGYESASQFSREYRRHFGEPPARDIARLRASAA
ncbi:MULTISPECIES: AraC family transcriptional regulator [Ramlibacter]|nr:MULTISPECIES: AraC family transcriptional regulator [Ramlibacter]